MDLYEYQARDLFEKYGVPVLRARTATGPYAAGAAAEELASPVVVVKAQVKTGGRGKAGGVKLARNPQEAIDRARDRSDASSSVHAPVFQCRGADVKPGAPETGPAALPPPTLPPPRPPDCEDEDDEPPNGVLCA